MEILIKAVQFMASTFHTDNTTVVIIMLVIIAILLIVQLIKKLFKIATTILMVGLLIFGVHSVTQQLENNYGIVIDSSSKTVTIPYTSVYQSEYRNLVYDMDDATINLYSGEQVIESIPTASIAGVTLSEADEVSTISITYDDKSIDLQTSPEQARIVYSVLKTFDLQNYTKMQVGNLAKSN